MAYATINTVYGKLAEYAKKTNGGTIRRFLVHCPKEKLQVVADLAPQTEEELKQDLAKLGLLFV